MTFKEVREYAHGDDIRFIDWNTSARFGHPFSKLFEEERELTVMLLIDISASNLIGSKQRTKQQLITEISAVLAFSAINNNDKVGAIFFSDRVEKYIAPKKGRDHVLYIVRTMLTIEPKNPGTHIEAALQFFNHTVRQKSIAFLCSDFADTGFEKPMKVTSIKHDLVCIRIFDDMEIQLPPVGLLPLLDAETGKVVWIDSSNKHHQQFYKNRQQHQWNQLKQTIKQTGAESLVFKTDEDFVQPLQRFFLNRGKSR